MAHLQYPMTSQQAGESVDMLTRMFTSGEALEDIPCVAAHTARLIAYTAEQLHEHDEDPQPIYVFGEDSAAAKLQAKCEACCKAIDASAYASSRAVVAGAVDAPVGGIFIDTLISMLLKWLKDKGIEDIVQWLIDLLAKRGEV